MKNAALAPIIKKLDSSLKQGIVLAIGMTLAGLLFGLVEKLLTMQKAEVKFGRKRINNETGEPEADILARKIEEIASYYEAVLVEFPDMGYINLSNGGVMGIAPEAFAMNRATPFLRTMAQEEVEILTKAAGVSEQTIRDSLWKQAEFRATAFANKAPAVLAEVESYLAMAPACDMEDIPEEVIDFEEKIESQIKKFKAGIAAGKKWDVADVVLFQADVDRIEAVQNMKAAA